MKVSTPLAEGASDPSAGVHWSPLCALDWLAGVQLVGVRLPPSCWSSCSLLPSVDS